MIAFLACPHPSHVHWFDGTLVGWGRVEEHWASCLRVVLAAAAAGRCERGRKVLEEQKSGRLGSRRLTNFAGCQRCGFGMLHPAWIGLRPSN